MGVFKPMGLIFKPFVTKCAIKACWFISLAEWLELGDAMSLSFLASALERALHLSVCLSDWKSV